MPVPLEIRSISNSDLPELGGSARASLFLDSRSLTDDLVKFRVFEDPDFDPALNLAAVVDGRIASFLSATHPSKFPPSSAATPGKTAWVKVFFTSEPHRRNGLASKLFQEVLSRLKSRGVEEVRFSDRGNWHFWPGIDLRYEDGLDFLQKKGFVKDGEYVDLVYDVEQFVYPRRVSRQRQELVTQGVEIRMAKPTEKGELGAWIESRFSPFWRDEAERAFAKDGSSTVVLARDGGKILGFVVFDGVAPGRFGPAGVDQSARGRGVGTVLLFDTFRAIKDRKTKEAVVHWTDHLFYYAQVPGLRAIRDYWVMKKRL